MHIGAKIATFGQEFGNDRDPDILPCLPMLFHMLHLAASFTDLKHGQVHNIKKAAVKKMLQEN